MILMEFGDVILQALVAKYAQKELTLQWEFNSFAAIF
jgi:hypothetical protein